MSSSATTPSLAPGRPTLLVVLVAPGDTFLTGTSAASSAKLKVLHAELAVLAVIRAGIPLGSLLASAWVDMHPLP